MNEKSYETNTVSYDEAFRPVLNVHLWFASTKRHAFVQHIYKQKKVEKNTKMKKTKEEKMMKKEEEEVEEEEERNETEGPG